MTGYSSQGKITLTPDVLLTAARMAALEVKGVNHMAPVPGGANRLFRRGSSDGVRISLDDNSVFVDLYVVLEKDINIREVSRNIQVQVARALTEMLGLEVGHVNVHIEDIEYEPSEA